MNRLKKKSQVVTFYDISSWIILVMGMIIWIMILRYENAGRTNDLGQQVLDLSNDEIFITMMRTDLSGTRISDQVMQAYSTGEEGDLAEKMDYLLNKLYSKEVCWKLYGDGEIILQKDCDTSGGSLLDSTVIVPYEKDGEVTPVEIHFRITGYKA